MGKRLFCRVSSKLHSSSGVTMLFALLLFLAASMVSAVIVSSAVSGVKRRTDDRAREQSMETLISAAQMLSEELNGASVIKTRIRQGDSSGFSYQLPEKSGPESGGTDRTGGPRLLGELLIECVKTVDQQGGRCEKNLQVSASVGALKTVDVHLIMHQKDPVSGKETDQYKISMTLRLDDSEEYFTYIDATANQSLASSTVTETDTTTEVTTITWNEPVIHGLSQP